MHIGDHTDPTELTPLSDEDTTESDGDDAETEYKRVTLAFEDSDIIIQHRHEGEILHRLSASTTLAHDLSNWFRKTTHQVLRLAQTSGRRDHVTLRGTTICQYEVRAGCTEPPFGVVHPTEDNPNSSWYVPLDYMDTSAITDNLCSGCHSMLHNLGLPRSVIDCHDEDPTRHPCPECGDGVAKIQIEKMRGVIAKHQFGRDPDHCTLTDEQLVEWDMKRLGVDTTDLPLYNDDPYEYLAEFPDSVTKATGIDAVYVQPPLNSKQSLSKTPADHAGVFLLDHPDWSHTCIIPYSYWKADLYEPSID